MTTTEIIQHPFLRDGIEPRLFQQTILNSCINKNTLVVLPTGTGKTIISILHAAYTLQKNDLIENGKYILILAPTKPLVHQHFQSFKKYLKLPSEKIVEISGMVNPSIRKNIIEKALIIIATPQTIRNDLIHNNIHPSKCILAYFDEAHRARGDYDYVSIAEALHENNPHIRIVALTASPGSTKEEIIDICRNLHIETIECRPKDDPEISKYIQDIQLEKIEVPLPLEFEEILSVINSLGDKEIEFLNNKGLLNKQFDMLYKNEILTLRKELLKNFRANYLEVMACNRLMYIKTLKETIESQGIPTVNTLLKNWQEKKSKSIKGLFNLEEFNNLVEKIKVLDEKKVVHPKLPYLIEILEKVDLTNSKVLIFCNLRATCYAISKMLKEVGINAKPFIGQTRNKEGGLSQKKQLVILEAFRRKDFPVLVSTSVLEEGLDVDECNLVIFYDGAATAIRKIQRAGRTGRKQKGRVIVLTTHHTIDTTAHFISSAQEQRMYKLLQDISWLNEELSKNASRESRLFAPVNNFSKSNQESNFTNKSTENPKENISNDKPEELSEKLLSFQYALEDLKEWETKKKNEEDLEVSDQPELKPNNAIEIIVDNREKNNKILFYLKKEGINLNFKQLDCGDYILSDRVVVEYKKGEDLLSSIIDGRLFEQLGMISNTYQIPILLIEGFPSGGIHPEAIAGAMSSFMIDFGVSIIQTQNSEETAVILKRIAIREQKAMRRRAIIRKTIKQGSPNENIIQIISSYPGINRILATRLLESFKTVRNIVNASIDDLQKVEGLGIKKSEKISTLSSQEFQ